MKKKELIRILKESDKLNEDLADVITDMLSKKTAGNVTTTEDVKVKPEAVKCDTKEQYEFLGFLFNGKLPFYEFDNKIFTGSKYNCISKQGYDCEFDFTTSHEDGYLLFNYRITQFADYITRESLTEKWHDFLIAEAVNRGFKEGVQYKSALSDCKFNVGGKLYFPFGNLMYSENKCGVIYDSLDGKWATIIEDTKEQSTKVGKLHVEVSFDSDKAKKEVTELLKSIGMEFTRFDMLNFAKYANPEYCAGQWIGLEKVLDYFIKNKGK